MNIPFQFITDSGHGWLQVPVSDFLQALQDGEGFSSYSYASPKTGYVYLEEDLDANTFVAWYKRVRGEALVYDVKNYDGDCFVRELPSLIDTRKG